MFGYETTTVWHETLATNYIGTRDGQELNVTDIYIATKFNLHTTRFH